MTRARQVRKRCSECRGWYLPSWRTAGFQLTCGVDCRRVRRRRLARRRRAGELEDHREGERERQERHRSKSGLGPDVAQVGTTTEMVAVPLVAVLEAVLRQMSRAGLGGDLRIRMRRKAEKLGQETVAVTRRLDEGTQRLDAEK